jgi:transposase
LEVYLVNARDTKNLPGRKSDVQESQWLMKLHTYPTSFVKADFAAKFLSLRKDTRREKNFVEQGD